jgi:hypothetical protein
MVITRGSNLGAHRDNKVAGLEKVVQVVLMDFEMKISCLMIGKNG